MLMTNGSFLLRCTSSGRLALGFANTGDAFVVLIGEALELGLLRHCIRYALLGSLHWTLVREHLIEVARIILRRNLWLEGCLDLTGPEAGPVDVAEEGVRLDIARILATRAQSPALISR